MSNTTSTHIVDTDIIDLPINEVRQYLELFLQLQKPIFLHGPIGVGKSELVQQVGKAQNRPVIDLRMSQLDLTDLRGIPFYNTDTKKMEWASPVCLPTDPNDNSILFLDELNCASPSIQASAYQLILDRKVGEYKLPKGVSVIAAGNRDTDRGVVFKIAAPLLNRFVHLGVKYDCSTWLTWALEANVHPGIIAFVRNNPEEFVTFDPKKTQKAFATPRTWKYASDCLVALEAQNADKNTLNVALTACLGAGLAIKVVESLREEGATNLVGEILNYKPRGVKAPMGSTHKQHAFIVNPDKPTTACIHFSEHKQQTLSKLINLVNQCTLSLAEAHKKLGSGRDILKGWHSTVNNGFVCFSEMLATISTDGGSDYDEILMLYITTLTKVHHIKLDLEAVPALSAFISKCM